ncbi:MAG: hypothetical protein QM831_06945 [Kofleriaceae bacterium]
MRGLSLVVVGMLALAPAVAHAEDPWAVGVTADQKASAQKLLEEGNALFLKKDYAPALAKYKEATTHWDHPAIRFNMVRCEIQLNQNVEASDDLALALKYGAAPLEEAVYTEALSYQKLLADQIGEIDIACQQPGVKVTLDGQALMNCPGKEHRRVKPGQHQLVGVKDGYLTKTTEVFVIGAKQSDAKVELVPLGKAAKVVHRYPTWMPWTVFGGGLVVAGFGVLMQVDASSRMDAYDRSVSTNCAGTGCAADDPRIDKSQKDTAKAENIAAISVMSVGAAAAVIGGVLLYMNRGRTVYEEQSVQAGPQVGFAPLHDNSGGMLTFSSAW